MRRRKVARPVLESMESKFLLTAQGVVTSAAMVAAPRPLDGSVQGHYNESSPNPDVGNTFTLSGVGRVGRLGRVAFSGEFGTPGNIASSRAEGTLKLVARGGTITLDLTGPVQSGSLAPDSFDYTVASGTGRFAGAHRSGHLTLDLTPDGTGHPVTPHHVESGRVAIRFG